jgi:hypothetical protein
MPTAASWRRMAVLGLLALGDGSAATVQPNGAEG